MIIACPSCTATFQVDDNDIGAQGRAVRCGLCGYSWFQESLSDEPPAPIVPAPPPVEPEPAAVAEPAENLFDPPETGDEVEAAPQEPAEAVEDAFDDAPDLGTAETDEAPDEIDVADDVEIDDDESLELDVIPDLPIVEPAPRGGAWVGWTVLAAFVVLVIAGMLGLRDTMVEIWPDTRKLYVALGFPLENPAEGFVIFNHQGSFVAGDDGEVLVIEGEIINRSREVKLMPPVRVVLRNEDREKIVDWTFVPTEVKVIPNEIIAFETRYADPPGAASGAVLRFDPLPTPVPEGQPATGLE